MDGPECRESSVMAPPGMGRQAKFTRRLEFAVSRCTGGACQSCAAPSDCGLDSNGDTCFCRDNAAKPGERMCTRKTSKLFVGGTGADCAAGEHCAPAGRGAIQCCTPFGA